MPIQTFSSWLRQQQSTGRHLQCKCEREINSLKPHCTNCGSVNNSASKAGESIMPDGTRVIAMRFKCRRCGVYFTDLDAFLNCEAPQLMPKMTQIRQTAKAGSALGQDAQNLVQALIQLRKDKGAPLGVLEGMEKPSNSQSTVSQENQDAPAQPGTPEWYAEHPEES